MNEKQVRKELCSAVSMRDGTVTAARKIGVSCSLLYSVMRGDLAPGKAILAYLDLEKVIVYRSIKNGKRVGFDVVWRDFMRFIDGFENRRMAAESLCIAFRYLESIICKKRLPRPLLSKIGYYTTIEYRRKDVQ